ncbi:MAG: haloacid dehalogenase [Bacteroidetes bacterium]|nr:MAG: haloacid dehalogenase [Bacteroidota bacterium]
MKKSKGLIFDFNGTLLWDTALHNRAWDLFLEKEGLTLSNEEKNRSLHGKNNADILRMLFKGTLSPKEEASFSKAKEDIYQAMLVEEDLQLAAGCIDLFEDLQKEQIPFTIATASDLYNMSFYFKRFGLDRWFDLDQIVYSDGSIKSKPDPQIFLMACERLQQLPKDVLVFEDSYSGIKAAEAAGAGRIVIVNSNNNDYSAYPYRQIRSFGALDHSLFSG